jgi:hypothetical protein
MCVCLQFCLSYPARKSHISCAVLYIHLWLLRLNRTVPHYLINSTTFRKKIYILTIKGVCVNFLHNICL